MRVDTVDAFSARPFAVLLGSARGSDLPLPLSTMATARRCLLALLPALALARDSVVVSTSFTTWFSTYSGLTSETTGTDMTTVTDSVGTFLMLSGKRPARMTLNFLKTYGVCPYNIPLHLGFGCITPQAPDQVWRIPIGTVYSTLLSSGHVTEILVTATVQIPDPPSPSSSSPPPPSSSMLPPPISSSAPPSSSTTAAPPAGPTSSLPPLTSTETSIQTGEQASVTVFTSSANGPTGGILTLTSTHYASRTSHGSRCQVSSLLLAAMGFYAGGAAIFWR